MMTKIHQFPRAVTFSRNGVTILRVGRKTEWVKG